MRERVEVEEERWRKEGMKEEGKLIDDYVFVPFLIRRDNKDLDLKLPQCREHNK